jgi:Kef-type K+ transport system membrane component KefB
VESRWDLTSFGFSESTPVADFFAELGKLLLMFFAGLEIDVAQFRRARNKSIIFGLVTTSIPSHLGTAVGLLFGYQPVAAVVIGSLLASHTLLAAPIVVRLGETRLEPITISFGATVLSVLDQVVLGRLNKEIDGHRFYS